jgi:processive 1,2-diacylglycerol beta-glucosyltransferase
MDEVATELCRADVALQIVAVAGHDERAHRRLERLRGEYTAKHSSSPVALHVVGWTDEIASLMRAAAVLVTKPGGVTTSEAVACTLPCVLFDAIPGPEQQNARRFVEAGAAIETRGSRATAHAALAIVRDENLRARMSASTSRLARPDAASTIARLALDTARESLPETTVRESSQETSARESSPGAMAGGAEAVERESLRRRTA